MLPVVFAHANSFPAGTYSMLFRLLGQRGLSVKALDRFGHDPRFPVSNNWPHLVEQLADFVRSQRQPGDTPPYLVGHSLGGFISVMVAAQYPELARGVLMLDSPLIGGWRATTLGVAKRTQLVGSVSPGKVSQRRRHLWPTMAAAQDYFQSKRLFSHWHPQVLSDYLAGGLESAEGEQVQLRFTREVETSIYNTLPHHLGRWLAQHPLQCPAAFIGGRASREIRQVGMDLTLRITQGRTQLLEGSHLFPMEQPVATAAAIEAALLNLEDVHHRGVR